MIRDDDRVCPVCGADDMKVGVGGGILSIGESAATAVSASAATGCGTGTFG
jgi:hypothetical protein